jgi:hypothetical protein
VWREVESVWRRVLGDGSTRPEADCVHMWQANALSDEFSLAKGWTKEKVDSLLNDLSNDPVVDAPAAPARFPSRGSC